MRRTDVASALSPCSRQTNPGDASASALTSPARRRIGHPWVIQRREHPREVDLSEVVVWFHQGFASSAVPWHVTRFADVLDRMLALPTDPPPGAPFERSLRAFEAALGDAPSDAAAAAWQAEWAVALGVTLPCSVGELKKAFRRLAFATHPDRPGGSHRAFLEAQAALQQALESFAAARRTRSGAGHYARQAAHVPPCTSTQSTYG